MASTVVVVGAGIAGLCCARHFLRAGIRVEILEDPSHLAASEIASGLSMCKGLRLPRDPLYRMKVEGHGLLGELLNDLNVEHGRRVIEPFLNANDYLAVRTRTYAGQFAGGFGNSCHFAPNLEPDIASLLNPSVRGYFCYPHEYWFNAPDLLKALRMDIARLGGVFTATKVLFIRPNDYSGVDIHRIVGETKLCMHADEVVLAAGIGSLNILKESGFDITGFIQSSGARYECIRSDEISAVVTHLHSTAFFWRHRLAFYDTDLSAAENPADVLSQIVSYLNLSKFDHTALQVATAMRLGTKDYMPKIGPVYFANRDQNRIWLATGFYKSGFQFAEIAGRNLVRQVIRDAKLQKG